MRIPATSRRKGRGLLRLFDVTWPKRSHRVRTFGPVSEPPLPRALWGRDLRTAALALMLAHPGSWTVQQLRRSLITEGFDDPGNHVLADALGHEVVKGRLVRVRRGTYGLGRIPPRTVSRIRSRLRSTPRYSI